MNCEDRLCELGKDTLEKVMRTLSDTLDDADRRLTGNEIDDIHHLWEIIRDVKMMTKKED